MLGQTLDQRYKVVSQIGAGGLADVYLGRDLKLGRPVAIKVLRSEKVTPVTLARLRSEVELQAQLDHPNIVRVYDVGTEPSPYLVMEFVDGADFETVLRRMSLASLPRRLHAVIQVTHGLEALHTRKFLHRDLKPSNILISRDGIAKLADFGLCRLLEQDVGLTREGSTVGTVLYIPPEQLTGTPVDHRADLYALGVILFQCCTDRVPFRGSAVDITYQHVYTPPESPRKLNPQVPSELESLVLRLLEKTPDLRPASAAAVRSELERILGKHWPDLTEASMRTALGAKARTRDDQTASLNDENYRTHDGGNDTLEIAAGGLRKSEDQLPAAEELPELKLVGESAAKTNKPIGNPKAQVPDATTAVDSPSPQRTPSRQQDTSAQVAPERTTKAADSPKKKPVSIRKGNDSESDEFGSLVQSGAYAPTLRRKTNQKSKSKSSNGITKLVLAGVVGVTVTIGAVWGISSLLRERQNGPGNETPVPPLARPTEPTRPTETPSPAMVAFASKIQGARIFVDGELRGRTPLKVALELQPGRHKLEIKFGKPTLTQEVDLKNGESWVWPATVDFSEDQIRTTCRDSVCLLKGPTGHGSGFLVDDQQTIVTAAHVISDVRDLDALEFIFSPSGSREFPNKDEFVRKGAKLIHMDRIRDVAIFHLNDPVPEDRPPFLLVDDDEKVELQTPVFGIGNPQTGLPGNVSANEVAHGLLTHDDPLKVVKDPDPKFKDSLEIREGYSGGPVIAKRTGEVIGIVSQRWSFILLSQNVVFNQTILQKTFLVRRALEVWRKVKGDEEKEATHVAKVRSDQQAGVGNSRVLNAGLYLAVMSSLYSDIAMKTAESWKETMDPVIADRQFQINQLETKYKKTMKKDDAKEKALREVLGATIEGKEIERAIATLRADLRKRFNPELVKMTEEWYGLAAKDEHIDADTRKKLEDANEGFLQLQKDATKLDGDVDAFIKRVEATKKSVDEILMPLLDDIAKQLEIEKFSYPSFKLTAE